MRKFIILTLVILAGCRTLGNEIVKKTIWTIDLSQSDRTDTVFNVYFFAETLPCRSCNQGKPQRFFRKGNQVIIQCPAIMHIGRFMLTDQNNRPFFSSMPVEPDDNVLMKIKTVNNKERLEFSGRGASKNQFFLDELVMTRSSGNTRKETDPGKLEANLKLALALAADKLKKVKNLSVPARKLLSLELQSNIHLEFIYSLARVYDKVPALRPDYFQLINSMTDPCVKDAIAIQESEELVLYLYQKIKVLLGMRAGNISYNVLSIENVYDEIKKTYTGVLREKLLAHSLVATQDMMNFYRMVDPKAYGKCLADADSIIQTPFIKEIISKRLSAHVPGSETPEFSLQDTAGNPVTLSSLRGKTILIDAWFTGCGGCLWFHRMFEKDIYPDFVNDSNFVVMSVSIDKKRDQWLHSIKEYSNPRYINVNAPLADNDPMLGRFGPNGYPFLVLIDKYGKLVSADISINGQGLKEMIQSALNAP